MAVHLVSCAVSLRRVSSVKVIAVEFVTAATEPAPRPMAPRDSVLSSAIPETILMRSAPETMVDVKDSFSKEQLLSRRGGWRTWVKDRSKRRKLGQLAKIVLIVLSERFVCRNLRVFNVGSWNPTPSVSSNEAQSLLTPTSVYTRVIRHEEARRLGKNLRSSGFQQV